MSTGNWSRKAIFFSPLPMSHSLSFNLFIFIILDHLSVIKKPRLMSSNKLWPIFLLLNSITVLYILNKKRQAVKYDARLKRNQSSLQKYVIGSNFTIKWKCLFSVWFFYWNKSCSENLPTNVIFVYTQQIFLIIQLLLRKLATGEK